MGNCLERKPPFLKLETTDLYKQIHSEKSNIETSVFA